uniref:Uncharacterized protein n=1 Tax=Ixodes ricinus TaxID=34613 RepID=A0A6B0V2M0_IXORI
MNLLALLVCFYRIVALAAVVLSMKWSMDLVLSTFRSGVSIPVCALPLDIVSVHGVSSSLSRCGDVRLPGRLEESQHGVRPVGQLGGLRDDQLGQVLQLHGVAVADVDDGLLCPEDAFLRVARRHFGLGLTAPAAAAAVLGALVGLGVQPVHKTLDHCEFSLQPKTHKLEVKQILGELVVVEGFASTRPSSEEKHEENPNHSETSHVRDAD